MSLVPEAYVHRDIKNRLLEIGWENGNTLLGIEEHTFVEYPIWKILIDRVIEINAPLFSTLDGDEKEKAIEVLRQEIERADEVKMLKFLKYGVEVNFRSRNDRIMLIDHEKIHKNSFVFLHETKFRGMRDNIKPDFTLFINGIPVVIIEAKRTDVPSSELDALRQIRRNEFLDPVLFKYVQIGVAIGERQLYTPVSPQPEGIVSGVQAFEWKLREPSRPDVFDFLKPERFLEILKYFTFFLKVQERGSKRKKIVARWNQYSAVKKIMNRIDEYVENRDEKRKGLIWHWQGSGKTFIMLFAANYFFTKHRDKNPVIFFVVDRKDLEAQHGGVFSSVEEEEFVSYFKRVESIRELRKNVELIFESQENRNVIPTSVYLTTLQKFQVNDFRDFLDLGDERIKAKKVVNKKEVLFLIDEVHRNQYGDLAAVMRSIFPEAMFFGFTGTPVFKKDRNTFQEFAYPEHGEYFMDAYFISDSIKDGFTLPIVHEVVEERDISIAVDEEKLKAFIEAYAQENPEDIEAFLQGKRRSLSLKSRELVAELRKSRVFLESDERVRRFSEYIAKRIYDDTEGFKFKAMVVAVNRKACVRFKKSLDEVLKHHFCLRMKTEENEEKRRNFEKLCENAEKLSEVVMTYQHNDMPEIEEFKAKLKERPELRGKSPTEINRYFVENFLERDYPKILIVTDMLLTGFDAPVLKVMYLDKPIYEHRLLQAVARVNRPYPDKRHGLVVDSIGLLKHLVKATNIYEMLATQNRKIIGELEKVVKGVEEKVKEFEQALESLKEEFSGWGIDVNKLRDLIHSRDYEPLIAEQQHVSDVLGILALRYKAQDADAVKIYNHLREIIVMYRSLGSHPSRLKYISDMEVIGWIYSELSEIIKQGKKARRFLDEVLRFIHENMDIGPFERILRMEIRKAKSDEDFKLEVSTRFYKLYNRAEEEPHDPVYRVIIERLKRLLEEWINRNLDLKDMMKEIEKLEKKANEYEKSRSGKPWQEAIIESLKFYLSNIMNKEIKSDFRNLRKELSRIKRLTKSIEKRLKSALYIDMRQGIDMEDRELSKIVDRLMEESIIPEVSKHVNC